jgi:DNA polymerase-3 subunit epsilon
MLKLTRPLAFFDLETTGTNTIKDRIVEIAVLKVMPDGTQIKLHQRINPEIPIPTSTTEIHKITNEDVKNMPNFKTFGYDLSVFLEGCDFAGYNSNYFDVPMLAEEFARAGIDFDWKECKFVDVQAIFHKNEPRHLKAAYQFYCGKDLTAAHSADGDVQATYEVLLSQLQRYDELKNDVPFLHKYSLRNNRQVDLAGQIVMDDKDIEIFNFGKYKGKSVAEVFENDKSYYNWMMQQDFAAYTKKIITDIKLRADKNFATKSTRNG